MVEGYAPGHGLHGKERVHQLQQYQQLLTGLQPTVSDAKAQVLAGLFPPDLDECFGLAWTLCT